MPQKTVTPVNAVNSADKVKDVFTNIDGLIDETIVKLSAVQTYKYDKDEIDAVNGVFNDFVTKMNDILTPDLEIQIGKVMQVMNNKLQKVYMDLVNQGIQNPTMDEIATAVENGIDFTDAEKLILKVSMRQEMLVQISGIYQSIEQSQSAIEELKSKIRK